MPVRARVCVCVCVYVMHVFVHTGAHVDPCGQEPMKLTASTGAIDSPGYHDGNYPNNANCQWLIEAPAGNVRHTQIRWYRTNN